MYLKLFSHLDRDHYCYGEFLIFFALLLPISFFWVLFAKNLVCFEKINFSVLVTFAGRPREKHCKNCKNCPILSLNCRKCILLEGRKEGRLRLRLLRLSVRWVRCSTGQVGQVGRFCLVWPGKL